MMPCATQHPLLDDIAIFRRMVQSKGDVRHFSLITSSSLQFSHLNSPSYSLDLSSLENHAHEIIDLVLSDSIARNPLNLQTDIEIIFSPKK